MLARSRGSFELPFKGYCGVTPGYPLPPTIFNVGVYTVIRHWVTVVAETEEDMRGIDLPIRYLADYFYAEYGPVVSPQPQRLKRYFDVLTDLLERVGLRKNMQKTLIMECQSCHIPSRISVEVYKRRMIGTGPTFW